MDARTQFREWVDALKARGLNQQQIAKRIGCAESQLSRLLTGERGAGMALAFLIESATADREGGPIDARLWVHDAATGTDG